MKGYLSKLLHLVTNYFIIMQCTKDWNTIMMERPSHHFTRTSSAPARSCCTVARDVKQTGRQLPACVEVDLHPITLPETMPVSPVGRSKFLDVFAFIPGLCMQLAVALVVICLNEPLPLLGIMPLVCKSMRAMRHDMPKAIKQVMQSLLRMDDATVKRATNKDDKDWLRLFKTYRSVNFKGTRPVLGSFISRSATARERFIPGGFEESLLDSGGVTFNNARERRAYFLRTIINTCLMRNGDLNQLIVYGIFSDTDNRKDALAVLEYQRKHDRVGDMDIRYDRFRLQTLQHLLQESYYIDDISDVLNLDYFGQGEYGNYPRQYGMHLTFDPADLERMNRGREERFHLRVLPRE